jgi:hypothetical protein
MPRCLAPTRTRQGKRKSRVCSHRGNRLTLGDGWTKTWTYFKNEWHEGNIGIMGPRTHAAWLCSGVFDGARAFDGVTPDLELHCARVNDSAKKLFLKSTVSTETWIKLAREGIKKFDGNTALYIRPMYWAEKEGPWVQAHDPESTQWCLSIYEAPMRTPKGFSITLSPCRRPTLSLSQQFPITFRGALPRIRQCNRLRYAGQCRRACNVQHFYGERRCRVYSSPERNIPGGHFSAKSNRATA